MAQRKLGEISASAIGDVMLDHEISVVMIGVCVFNFIDTQRKKNVSLSGTS